MDQKQKSWLLIALAALLAAVAWWAFWPPGKQIRKGLDLQGGLSVILTARETTSGVTPGDMERAERIIEERVNGLGVSEASVQRQGQQSILVQLPGIKDPQAALRALGQTGRLEFVEVNAIEDSATVAAIQSGEQNVRLKRGTYEPFLTGGQIQDAATSIDPDRQQPVVNLDFKPEGERTWADYTTRLARGNQQIAIVLDGTVVSAPAVQTPILNGNTQISGDFTPESARRLATILQSGALPVALDFSESQVVGPTLGAESLAAGLLAGLLGLAAVAVYMVVYYRGLGLVSWFSLAAFLSIFLGVLAILSRLGAFALSLPGIAGIVLTVGLAADSSILMFERFKEEVRMGRSLRSAAKSGTWHAFGTSVDADVVTLVTAAVIFALAIGPVRGFALTLMIGIGIDLSVAYLFTRNAIILLADSAVVAAPWFFNVNGGGADA